MNKKMSLTIGLIVCLSLVRGVCASEASSDSEAKLRMDAAQEHILAAEQLEESAAHHRKVAALYKSGRLEEAGWNAYMAYAHNLRAQSHIEAAAMLHLSEKRNAADKAAPAEPK